MTDVLPVSLSSWIIQDENYGDFKKGERRAFALEFYASAPFTIVETRSASRSLRHTAGSEYEVTGQVTHSHAEWWVIDTGVVDLP